MNKKLLIVTMAMSLLAPFPALAANVSVTHKGVKKSFGSVRNYVYINKKKVSLANVPVFGKDDAFVGPAYNIFSINDLGSTGSGFTNKNTLTLKYGSNTVVLTEGSATLKCNGKNYQAATAPIFVHYTASDKDRWVVPLSAVCRNLGLIYINSGGNLYFANKSSNIYDATIRNDYMKAEEMQRKAEEEAKKAEEARKKAEEEAKRKEEEARKKAEEEAKRKAEEERKKAEEEAKRKAEEEAKRKAEEAKKKAEEEKKKAEEEAAKKKAEEEAKKKAAEDEARAAMLKRRNAFLGNLSTYSKTYKKYGTKLISYKAAYAYKTYSAALARLQKGQKITTNCGTPINWAIRDMGVVSKSNTTYFGTTSTGTFATKYALGNMEKYTERVRTGAVIGKTIKQAVDKKLLQPGDIIGFDGREHTFAYTGDKYFVYDGGSKACNAKFANGIVVNYSTNYQTCKIKEIIRWK